MNIEKMIGVYVEYCRSEMLRPKTIEAYKQGLYLFAAWLKENENVTDFEAVKDVMIRRYMLELQNRGKYTFSADRKHDMMIDQSRRTDLCDQLFFAVCFRSEEGSLLKAVQAAGVSCAVGQFVKGRAVILCGFGELSQQGKGDAVSRRPIEGPVAFLMLELDAASFAVVMDDGVGGFVCVGGVGKLFLVLCFQPFALVDVENVEVSQEGNLLLFVRLFVFLFDELPEDNHGGFLAFFHFAAFFLTLGKGDVFAGPAKQHLIEKAVRVPGDVTDGVTAGDPRLLPRDDPVFELGHDAIGDFLVDIHNLLPFFLKGSKALW